ncbi:MAG: outer membrane lipoprotein carrier protein LolA [Candidatus Edwardsbacteria bacterium]|nr:outer membrane lipoprotein carrier protein LolA [Candidatus Edwardsbacteria bacterium]MBU1576549.1 outer membrane lipoprotein carrier protein LolA [Candidatus Edwardsbacteria bacterium]MBU2463752.1 outer membrane lipoprotein carrier protein LolA [Candidatus Edwardsbacteria bacterium]
MAVLGAALLLLISGMSFAQEAEAIMAQVRARYKDVTDFKADLELISCASATGTCHRFEGKVEMKRPNKLRMDIKKPETQQIICDGKNLWLYLEKDKQVFRTDLAESKDFLVLLNPLGKLLTGKVKNGCKTNGNYQCWLDIPEFKELFKEIKVIVDKKTYEITGIDVVDVNDNSSEYRFTKIKTNSGIKDDRFNFVVPKNAKLIDAN